MIALADGSPRGTPPEPFTEFADGSGWSLRRADFDHARQVAQGANGPLPLLTTVGTTTALDLALTTNSRTPAEAYGLSSSLLFAVDLEAGRVISVQANDESSTIEALTMMALELATSETADQAEIVCVGFGHRLATFDRVMVVDDISEILSDLETITGRAVYAAGDASPFATRVGNGAADTWNPVIVFHANEYDPNAATMIELASRTDGGVTAVCGYPTGTGWTMRVDGDRVSCPDLPGELAHHSFKRPELDGVELVPDLFDEPWGDTELDDDFWKPMDPADADHTWNLADSEEASWRPMRSVTDTERPHAPPAERGSSIAVVVNQTEAVTPDKHPDELWDSISTVDPDSWPGTEIPALKELRHSIEHLPPTGEAGPPNGEASPSTVEDPPATEPPSADPPVADVPSTDPPSLDLGPSIFDRITSDRDESAKERHLWVVNDSHTDASTAKPAELEADIDVDTDVSADCDPDGTVDPSETADPSETVESLETVAPIDAEIKLAARLVEPVPEDQHLEEEDLQEQDLEDVGIEEDIRVSVLGNFTIEDHHVGDRSKPWKYTKTPELVLYLLLHPAGASQDLLMEQLFPEQPPNRPRLNQLVSDARTKALGKDQAGGYHLPHASPTEPFYKLAPSVGLDLRDFAQHCANARAAEAIQVQQREWEAALNLVQGRPFTLPHDGYEWAIPEIEATIIKVEEAAVALTDIAFELGDYRLAVWATKKGLLTETGYYELLVKRGRAALLLQDPEEIVRAFADLQVSLEYSGAPEEGMPDLSSHPDLEDVYNELSSEGRTKDRPPQ